MDPIDVPWITKDDIFARAEALLDEHELGDAPVEADYVLESIFDIEIVVADELYRTTSVHAFVAGALIAPGRLLEATANEVVGIVKSHGIELTPLLEVEWPTIFREIARRMNANERTIAYRMEELGLYRKYI